MAEITYSCYENGKKYSTCQAKDARGPVRAHPGDHYEDGRRQIERVGLQGILMIRCPKWPDKGRPTVQGSQHRSNNRYPVLAHQTIPGPPFNSSWNPKAAFFFCKGQPPVIRDVTVVDLGEFR
jgi:hypothetical protein